MYRGTDRGERNGRLWVRIADVVRVGTSSWRSGGSGNDSGKQVVGKGIWADVEEPEGWSIGGIRSSENGSLCGITRPIGVPGDGIGPDVNHMGWYRLRTRVAIMMFMV